MRLSFFISTIFCISLTTAFFYSSEEDESKKAKEFCDKAKNCDDCAALKSPKNATLCGWCVRDLQCYAFGTEHGGCPDGMLKSTDCSVTRKYPSYDQDLALYLLDFAAAAYSDSPQFCLDTKSTTFAVVNVTSAKADFLSDIVFGYVAISTAKKSIVVSMRGTDTSSELIMEILRDVHPSVSYPLGGSVDSYFYQGFQLLYPGVKVTMERLVSKYPDYDVLVTGHSLGGALASFTALQLVADGLATNEQVTLITYGAPRIGNYEFAGIHDSLLWNSWRLVHHRDLVPHVPFCFGWSSCWPWSSFGYHHGVEIFYPEEDMDPEKNIKYQVCLDAPANEDHTCSDRVISKESCTFSISPCIEDHTHYFNIRVGDYHLSNCTVPNP